jgi:thymidylate synthase ThyX
MEFVNISFLCSGSASFYAQLKRHRMSSILVSPYSAMKFTLPVIFKLTNLDKQFRICMDKSEDLYKKILMETRNMYIASYILTCAHRRNILVQMNLRELYHFAKLRADRHAGKEIRVFAKQLIKAFKYLEKGYVHHDLKQLIKGKKH